MNKPHEEDFDMIYAALLGGVISGVISNALPIIV